MALGENKVLTIIQKISDQKIISENTIMEFVQDLYWNAFH